MSLLLRDIQEQEMSDPRFGVRCAMLSNCPPINAPPTPIATPDSVLPYGLGSWMPYPCHEKGRVLPRCVLESKIKSANPCPEDKSFEHLQLFLLLISELVQACEGATSLGADSENLTSLQWQPKRVAGLD